MELRDYLRMVRQGWILIVVATLVGALLAVLYVTFASRRYEATTSLYVTASAPSTVDDLERASNFSTKAVATYASIIDSGSILDRTAAEVSPPADPEILGAAVSTSAPEGTTLINLVASDSDPSRAAQIANKVAEVSTTVIPRLELSPTGRPLVRVQQTRLAVPPILAVSPNVKRSIGIGTIGGLLFGLIASIVRQTLDTRIRRRDTLAGVTQVPVLAELPSPSRASNSTLVAREQPNSSQGAAYRTLRTNLGFVDSWEKRSLVCTNAGLDPAPDIAANLAWTLAMTGSSILLVDADLRGGQISQLFGLNVQVGLANVIRGEVAYRQACAEVLPSALYVLGAGSEQKDSTDLLSTKGMDSLLRRAEHDFDYVVLHAPPVRSTADAAILAGRTGGVLLGVQARATRLAELDAALTALAIVRVKPVGIVLTGATAARADVVASRFAETTPASARHSAAPDDIDSPTLRQRPMRPVDVSEGEHGRRQTNSRAVSDVTNEASGSVQRRF